MRTRREVIVGAGGLCGVLSLGALGADALAEVGYPGTGALTGASNPIIDRAIAELVTTWNAGTSAGLVQFSRASVALDMALAEMDRGGVFSSIDTWVSETLASGQPVVPPENATAMLAAALRERGAVVDEARLSTQVTSAFANWRPAMEFVAATGFSQVAAALPPVVEALADPSRPIPQLEVLYRDTCHALANVIAVLTVIGIMYGIGCALGCLPCCGIALVVGAAAGLAGWLYAYYC